LAILFLALWAMESTTNIVLAIDRCLVFCLPRLSARLFEGGRTWVWVAGLAAYFLVFLSQVSVIFTPMQFAWAYSPYTGYRDELNDQVK
jgi:hypothetical protein